MRFGSLFSGIGGFDLGFERAGMQCAWQVEINTAASSVLGRHWPHVARYSDVRKVENLEPVDLICGGFPCQDLSVAGKRKGLAGERSGLWFEFHRVLGEVGPGWAVIENVPGLLSSNGGRDFAVILRGLAELGYGVAWRILDAQYFGVAQRRRRVFIVGHLGDGRAAEVLFEREGGCWHPAPGREKREGTASYTPGSFGSYREGVGALRHNLRDCGGGSENLITFPGMAQAGAGWAPPSMPISEGHTGPLDTRRAHVVAIPDPAYALADATGTSPGSGRDAQDTFVVGTLSCNTGPRGHDAGNFLSNQAVDGGYVQAVRLGAPAVAWHENKQGQLTEDKEGIAKALRSGASHSYQGFGVRRLTPTECERLQGFPDGHTADQGDTARYRQLGNAVAVPVAEWLGRKIVESLDPEFDSPAASGVE